MQVNSFSKFSILLIVFILTLISCKKEPEPLPPVKPPPGTDYSKLFIAHGGGAVDGYTKTNSLEALYASYAKGFRMFELDFQLTTDNKIVAVHDPIFITEAQFLSQPILGKFTPMNIDTVNRWFRDHPDAILVTDKTNRPDLFAEQFQFKDRLIMELFTWEAIAEAITLGITPMVSQNIFWDFPDIEKRLEEWNLKIVGMHRDSIIRDKALLIRLKAKGIKTYVWFTSSIIEGMMPEEYIWRNDMNFCYGMYANSILNSWK
jgi:hypothetical protein